MIRMFTYFLLLGAATYLFTFRLQRQWRISLAICIGLVLPILLLIAVIIIGDRPTPGSIIVH